MTLHKKSLDLSYKILANLRVKDYNVRIVDIRMMLLVAFTEVYVKARHDESNNEPMDDATQMFNVGTV